jgi:hypothetical protein
MFETIGSGEYDSVSDELTIQAVPPDLGTQLEDLFVWVMECEKWAAIESHIDSEIRYGKV